MPRTIHCPECGVSLNVPDAAIGRRLKCPKCAVKFTADGAPVPSKPASNPASKTKPDLDRVSSLILPTSSGPPAREIPNANASLRELFGDTDSVDSPRSRTKPEMADAMDLLKDDDDEPRTRRARTAAEARAKARRCPTCGSLVPQGMSLCNRCGLDLESGKQIDLMEDLVPVAGPRRGQTPVGVWFVGLLAMALSVIFMIISLIKASNGQTGYLFLLAVCAFGAYAGIQFLRSKSVKLLFVALTLGALVNVVALIVLPIYSASIELDVKEHQINPNAVDEQDIVISNMADRLDVNELTWGIAVLVAYGAISTYLFSPPVRRHFSV